MQNETQFGRFYVVGIDGPMERYDHTEALFSSSRVMIDAHEGAYVHESGKHPPLRGPGGVWVKVLQPNLF